MTWLVLIVVLGVLLAAVATAVRRRTRVSGTRTNGSSMDAFALGEPWRRFVAAAQRSQHRAHRVLRRVRPGPLRDRLISIADRLDHAIDEVWGVAHRGNEIDRSIRQLDPTALRSRLSTFHEQALVDPSPELDAAIASVERQLEAAERLRVLSNRAATRLRLTTTRLDELAARAEEVGIGLADTERYRSDVDALVDELEGIRQAIDETRAGETTHGDHRGGTPRDGATGDRSAGG